MTTADYPLDLSVAACVFVRKFLMCSTAKSTEICSRDTKQFEVLMGTTVHCIQCGAACMPRTSGLVYMYMHALHATAGCQGARP